MSLFRAEVFEEFERSCSWLDVVFHSVERDLFARLEGTGILIRSFSGRRKSAESFRAKISRPDRTYSSIWDVTDLIGFRIVTDFEDSIEPVARLIEAAYAVDFVNSRNRLQFEDHEKFGYRSLHYICRVPQVLANRAEIGNMRFEIQVRTALQDVWAEIEHGLGYKAADLAPSKLRRRFSRLSSLLEIADEELAAIRSELGQYVEGKRDHSRLDLVSLKDTLAHPDIVQADQLVANALGVPVSERSFYPDYLLRALQLVEFSSPQSILRFLGEYKNRLVEFLPIYFEFAQVALGLEKSSVQLVLRGYSLLFLAHVKLIESESIAVNRAKQVAKFYTLLDPSDDPKKAWLTAERLTKSLQGTDFDRAGGGHQSQRA